MVGPCFKSRKQRVWNSYQMIAMRMRKKKFLFLQSEIEYRHWFCKNRFLQDMIRLIKLKIVRQFKALLCSKWQYIEFLAINYCLLNYFEYLKTLWMWIESIVRGSLWLPTVWPKSLQEGPGKAFGNLLLNYFVNFPS